MTQRAHLKTVARPVPGPPRCRVMRWTESVGSIDQVSRQPDASHGGRRYVPVSKWRYALDPPSAKGVGSGPERCSNVAVTRQMRPHGHSIASSTWPVISPGVSSPHSQWIVVEERWFRHPDREQWSRRHCLSMLNRGGFLRVAFAARSAPLPDQHACVPGKCGSSCTHLDNCTAIRHQIPVPLSNPPISRG